MYKLQIIIESSQIQRVFFHLPHTQLDPRNIKLWHKKALSRSLNMMVKMTTSTYSFDYWTYIFYHLMAKSLRNITHIEWQHLSKLCLIWNFANDPSSLRFLGVVRYSKTSGMFTYSLISSTFWNTLSSQGIQNTCLYMFIRSN